jgi:hypothetical protein
VRIIAAAILTFVAETSAIGYPCSNASPLGTLSFLAGQWVGQPKGQPVFQGFPGVLQSGDFTGYFELDQWVLILKSLTAHKDMMIVYAGCGSDRGIGALYIDGTAHTVQHCTWTVLYPPNRSKPNGVTFVSLREPNLPTFRLTYTEVAPGNISIELQAGASTYTSTARRLPH